SALTDTDGSESLSITIGGVPSGATLSAGTNNGDGTWTLEPGDLAGLTVTPPANSDVDFQLTVTATSTEADGGDAATTSGTIDVSVAADADAPRIKFHHATGTEDQPILLDVKVTLVDTDGSESVSITVAGVPNGATLSAGTDNGDGTWTLTQANLTGLTITPPANSDADFQLTFTATTTEADGGDTATATGVVNVTVGADADAPSLTLSDASGTEDQAISLNLSAALTDTDGSESLSVTIAGVPSGATLSAGTNNGDGTWTLEPGDLAGLTITPPAGSDADFQLTVTATSTEATGGDTATTSGTVNVSVAADADAPTLTLNDASGNEDQAISLNLSSALTDTDGSESLSITIGGVPSGATLSAGTDNGDGTWTLSSDDLSGLTITPPANSDVDFQLTVTATSTEGDGGDTATTSGTIDVSVTAVADAPVLSVALGDGTSITGDGSVTVTNMNDGSSAGYNNSYGYLYLDGDGNPTSGQIIWANVKDDDGATFTIDNVNEGDVVFFILPDGDNRNSGLTNGMSVTAHQDAYGKWYLKDSDGHTLSSADGNEAYFSDASLNSEGDSQVTDNYMHGNQNWEDLDSSSSGSDHDFNDFCADVQWTAGATTTEYPLDISASLTDTDGSESLSITIGGLPSGAILSAGTDNGDGTWTLDAGDLAGLTYTHPAGAGGALDLSVTVTVTDNDGSTHTEQVDVHLAESTTSGGGSGTISAANYADTDNGFTVSARKIVGGVLSDASVDNVSVYGGMLGVAGSVSNIDSNIQDEMAYDQASGQSEQLIIDFDNDIDSVNVSFDYLHTASHGETGHWAVYKDGALVAEGDFSEDGANSNDGTITIDPDGDFDQLVLSANDQTDNSAGSDYFITDISFTEAEVTTGDTVTGGDNADMMYGSDAGDVLSGGGGDDILYGNAGDDTLSGGTGDDTLYDGAGNDTMYGDDGNDVFVAGAGDDQAWGGAGNDLFIFGAGDGTDTFSGGNGWTDTVQLDGMDGAPNDGNGWTLVVDGDAGYTIDGDVLTFEDGDASGTVTLDDGSTLTFEGVEKIEW
ncbi:MAG: hypothetical protein KDE22_10125, partial [Rhodobacterales bacterium]|nr:hypothetical protein [Rhodobacterales bacterium]